MSRSLSLNAKILFITLFLTLGVGFVTIVVFISTEIPEYRNLSSLFSDILNTSSAASSAILENNPRLAVDSIAELRTNLDIVSADIFTYQGGGLVQLTPQNPHAKLAPEKSWFPALDKKLDLIIPIYKQSNPIAAIYIKTKNNNDDIYSLIKIIVLLSLIAIFIAMALQDMITKSFVSLVDAMKTVTQQNDYSVRVKKTSDDEVGILIDSFNAMLDLIQQNETMQRATQEQIKKLAYYDALTGLPNKDLFKELLSQELDDASLNETLIAVLHIKIDNLDVINATYGIAVTDALLKMLSHTLMKIVNQAISTVIQARLARFKHNVFMLSLDNIASVSAAEEVAKSLLHALEKPVTVNGNEIQLALFIGVAVAPQQSRSSDDILQNAETALYSIKQNNKNHYALFDESMNAMMSKKIKFEQELRGVLERKELLLMFQPKYNLAACHIGGAEALLRWQSPAGIIPPDEFISIAEETGHIIEIGRWVLHEACLQCKAWQQAGFPHMQIAVNVSPRQFDDPELVTAVKEALEASQLKPEHLELELTESIIMLSDEKTLKTLRDLKALNVKISIDDFGTGYSSLRYLIGYPVDKIKIDKSFVSHLIENKNNAIITKAIVNLAHNLNLTVVAEGVETKAQLDYLTGLGCEEIQGYIINRPVIQNEFLQLLQAQGSAYHEA